MYRYIWTFIFYIYLKQVSNFLIRNELETSFDLVKALGIQQCIVVPSFNKDMISDIKAFSERNIPITYMSYNDLLLLFDENVHLRTGVIIKEKDPFVVEQIFEMFSRAGTRFRFRNYIWLAFLVNDYQMVQANKLKIPYDFEFIVIQSKDGMTYTLTEIYTINGKYFSSNFGIWEAEKSFVLKPSNASFYQRRNNCQKIEVRILIRAPELHIIRDEAPVKLSTNVDMYETLSGLADMMNLTNTYDVEWTGETLAAVYSWDFLFIRTPFKNPAFTLGPFSRTLFYCYIKYPETHLRSDYYLQPFDTSLWIVLFSLIVIGTVFVLIAQKFTRYKERFLADALFLGLESFCNQCGKDVIKNAYLRSICILLRLSAIVLICGYGAVITSFIAVKVVTPPFRNLEEFVSHGEYRFIVNRDSFTHHLLMNSDYNASDAILTNFTKLAEGAGVNEIFEDLCRDEKYAFLADVDLGLLKGFCPIFKIPTYFLATWSGMFVAPNSPYRIVFNKNLIRFFENGNEARFRSIKHYNLKNVNKEDPFRPVLMDQMAQVMLIPFIGVLLGSGIFMIEIIKQSGYLRKFYRKFNLS